SGDGHVLCSRIWEIDSASKPTSSPVHGWAHRCRLTFASKLWSDDERVEIDKTGNKNGGYARSDCQATCDFDGAIGQLVVIVGRRRLLRHAEQAPAFERIFYFLSKSRAGVWQRV